MRCSAFFLQYANNKFIVMHTKYQWYPKSRSMLNRVSKYAQCEERTFQVQTGFQSVKPKQKILKFQNFLKNILGNLVKMMYVKYQCHPKSIGMLNHVPKFVHCEMRLKFVYVKNKFSNSKPETKLLKFQNFPKKKKLSRNIVKIICTKYQFNRKMRLKFI